MPLRRNRDGLPIEQRAAMAQVAVRKLFPEVDSPERLKAVLLDWVAAVNAAARDVL